MLKVVITSQNIAKINAVKAAFQEVFPDKKIEFNAISVESGVSEQPMSNEETLEGARNRIKNAQKKVVADYYVGMEAGIEKNRTFAWMVIHSKNKEGLSRSACLPLPPQILKAIASGKELGEAMDEVFKQKNIKQKGGAIGIFTNHCLTRTTVYQQALILALIPFIHPDLYSETEQCGFIC